MRKFLLLIAFFGIQWASAQNDSLPRAFKKDSLMSKERGSGKTAAQKKVDTIVLGIRDYKIITQSRDTTFLDTTLTIQKEYKYNYLRRDDFELMPFANVANPYNALGVRLERETWYPELGARARHFNYKESRDIKYFNVPTPVTDLFFKTTFEQGQMLDALLTFNTSRNLNFSVAFMGTRSLGKYQESEGESGNFRTTANYVTRNGKYRLMAHIAAQDIDSEEYGGLSEKELQFESGDPEFGDRSRIEVRLNGVTNRLLGKRYFLDHEFNLLSPRKDSLKTRKTRVMLGHRFEYETKYYQYNQSSDTGYFGPLFTTPIGDRARLKTMFNQVRLGFSNPSLGQVEGFVNWYNYNYFFNSLLITDEGTIPNGLEGEEITLGGTYDNQIGPFQLKGQGGLTLVGDLTSSYLDAEASIDFGQRHSFFAGIHSSSRLPDFNFLLYQSDYENFNWYRKDDFENENVYALRAGINSEVFGNWEASFSTVDGKTVYRSEADESQIADGDESLYVKPYQAASSISYLRVKVFKEFKWRKWALANTVLYQNVSQDEALLNLPELVTRNSLYYSSDIFKKAMFIQTGVTLKYFTSYNMNAYNPLLADFYVQDREELGGFPMLDFFINAKVRQTRIYLKAEHFNSSFSGNNFYAAPDYPYRDFVIRFGLVWNFFS